jgi:hypothetical protein
MSTQSREPKTIKKDDVFISTFENGIRCVCVAFDVDDDHIHATVVNGQYSVMFARSGLAAGHGECFGQKHRITFHGPFPADLEIQLLDLNRRLAGRQSPPPASTTPSYDRVIKEAFDHADSPAVSISEPVPEDYDSPKM